MIFEDNFSISNFKKYFVKDLGRFHYLFNLECGIIPTLDYLDEILQKNKVFSTSYNDITSIKCFFKEFSRYSSQEEVDDLISDVKSTYRFLSIEELSLEEEDFINKKLFIFDCFFKGLMMPSLIFENTYEKKSFMESFDFYISDLGVIENHQPENTCPIIDDFISNNPSSEKELEQLRITCSDVRESALDIRDKFWSNIRLIPRRSSYFISVKNGGDCFVDKNEFNLEESVCKDGYCNLEKLIRWHNMFLEIKDCSVRIDIA